jgi:hypothetical protein
VTRRFGRLALLCALCCAAAAGPLGAFAEGASLSPPVADCNAHGGLTQHYTVKQLQTALATMPADIKQYTSCPDVINHQLLVQLGKLPGSGGPGSGGGSFLPVWLIVALVLLVAGGGAFGVVAARRSGVGGDDEERGE